VNPLLDFFDRAVPIMAGGGVVQGIIYLLKRRGEDRKLSADTDSTVVQSASASVALASRLRDEAMQRMVVLEAKVKHLEEQVIQLAGEVAEERAAMAAAVIRETALNHEIAILKGKGGSPS
jgi:hypothetical protein